MAAAVAFEQPLRAFHGVLFGRIEWDSFAHGAGRDRQGGILMPGMICNPGRVSPHRVKEKVSGRASPVRQDQRHLLGACSRPSQKLP
jgi:hypothetical protein